MENDGSCLPSWTSPSGPPAKKRCRESRDDRVIAWLEGHEKRTEKAKEKRDQKKLEKLTEPILRCHAEKMARLDQALANMPGGQR